MEGDDNLARSDEDSGSSGRVEPLVDIIARLFGGSSTPLRGTEGSRRGVSRKPLQELPDVVSSKPPGASPLEGSSINKGEDDEVTDRVDSEHLWCRQTHLRGSGLCDGTRTR